MEFSDGSATGLVQNDQSINRCIGPEQFQYSMHLSHIRQREPTNARGGPVPKICKRVPSHGRTGPTNGKQTSLESLSWAMASLRQADGTTRYWLKIIGVKA